MWALVKTQRCRFSLYEVKHALKLAIVTNLPCVPSCHDIEDRDTWLIVDSLPQSYAHRTHSTHGSVQSVCMLGAGTTLFTALFRFRKTMMAPMVPLCPVSVARLPASVPFQSICPPAIGRALCLFLASLLWDVVLHVRRASSAYQVSAS